MTRLVKALRTLGLDGRIGRSGRWVTLNGERCRVYVVEAPGSRGYLSWCDDPAERTVEHDFDPITAILSGLRRAADHPAVADDG